MSRVFVFVMVCGAAACGPTVSVTPLNSSPRPLARRPAGSVEMFTAAAPARPYVEVAVLQASGGQTEEHYAALREEAGAIGCDALVVTGASTQATSVALPGNSTATCVMWTIAPQPVGVGPGPGPH